uniref:Putative transposon protein n=1 Tax=Phyllostachys edulis TaxID=38705 RepID=D3IVC7_PHYED|nr:putative transposon protein [Phyllostachys edulis]
MVSQHVISTTTLRLVQIEKMTSVTNRDFEELAQLGQNYLTWASDVEIVLGAKKLHVAIELCTSKDMQSAHNYLQDGYKEHAELIDIMQVVEAQDEVIRKNYISQSSSSKVVHEVNASSYRVRKPHSKERDKKDKVMGRKTKQNAQAKNGGKKKRDEKPYGTEDPQSLVAPMDVDSPTAASITPSLDIAAAAAGVAEEEKMDMEQI